MTSRLCFAVGGMISGGEALFFKFLLNFELASLRAAGRVRALELTACRRSFVGEHACVVFGYTWVFLGT